MTPDERNTLIGLMTGLQMAIAHLANVLAQRTNLSPDELAASFEASAENVPADAENAPLIQLPLRQVALGIRSSAPMDPAWLSRHLQ